jgi:hypothetical protein
LSAIPEEAANNTQEPARKATPHTAVLQPLRRRETDLLSGLIPASKVLHAIGYDGVTYEGMGVTCRSHIRIGDEVPFYEVAFKGRIHRMLARPAAGQESVRYREDLNYELVRTWAPGLRADGWFAKPPTAVPNTPRALVEELLSQIDASLEDILSQGYSIFHYRLDHGGKYPDTMEPKGYTLREVLLAEVDADGQLNTLYETPKGINPERWTMILTVLDGKHTEPTLGSYASSAMAAKELGEAGVLALRRALQLRGLPTHSSTSPGFSHFVDVFPRFKNAKKLDRDVGGSKASLI